MALMGTGTARGENRAIEAAQKAISSTLLEESTIQGARGVLINITGSSDLLLHEVSEAASIVQRAAVEDANIIFGAVLDDQMTDEIKITVIATGFDKKETKSPADAIQHKPEVRVVETRSEPVPVPLAQVARANSLTVSVQETVSSSSSVFDKNDLDVPAFMRRKLAE